jgi:predicted membrane protein
MPGDRPLVTPRLIIGLFILATGALFLLDNLHLAEARVVLPYLWPAGFLTLGVVTVLRRCHGWAWGLVWIVAGVWLLGDQLGIVRFNFWEMFWPLTLLAVGAMFVWRAIAGPRASARAAAEANSDDVVNVFAMMAGNERRNSSTAFRGGDVSAFMGGCALDLRQAQLADGEAVLDVFAFWGGIELKVPEDWEVVSKVMVLMAGIEDKTKPRVGPAKGRLVVRGLALMGGIEIAN